MDYRRRGWGWRTTWRTSTRRRAIYYNGDPWLEDRFGQYKRQPTQRLNPTDRTAYIISSVLALVCLAGLLALLT